MTTVTTYNLTLNDITATMWVNTQPDELGYIDVSLGIYSGQNEVTTSSKVKVLPPKNEVVEVFDSTPTFNQKNTLYFCAQIRSMLDRFYSVNEKEERAKTAEELLEYLSTTGLEFTKCHEQFRKVVVKKCYELKLCNPECPVVTTRANQLLTALGEIVNVPDSVIEEFYCKDCEKYHHSKVHSPKPVIAPSLPITTTASSEFNSDNEGRAKTMKKLFANNKLTYTDDVMSLYNEWLKTYIVLLGRSNRYQKMTRFIEIHKHLFSSTF